MTVNGNGNGNGGAAGLSGRVALVTGGSRGIGAAAARVLAVRGAAVAVNYHRDAAAAERLTADLTALAAPGGGKAMAVGADVTDPDQVASMVSQVESALGPIDILVLSASGSATLRVAPALELSYSDIADVVAAQVKAFLHPVHAVAPEMVARGRGAIIVVGAAASRRPSANFITVAMAKGALDAGLRALAHELGPHGVRVNGVGPGLILTDTSRRMPEPARAAIAQRAALRRNGTPEDIAEIIAFLASDHSAYLTGSYLVADGGTAMP